MRARRDVIGQVIGGRRVLADLQDVRSSVTGKIVRRVLCVCLGCGEPKDVRLHSLWGTATCAVCCREGRSASIRKAWRARSAATSERIGFFVAVRRGAPWLWSEAKGIKRMIHLLPIEARRDIMARRSEASSALVALVGPMTRAEIAALWGMTQTAVGYVESRARGMFECAASKAGLEPREDRDEYVYPDHGEAA